jgi:hypothetical protein
MAPSLRPDSPPIDPIFGSGSRPQARIAGDLTFHCLVRFPRMLLAHSHWQVLINAVARVGLVDGWA